MAVALVASHKHYSDLIMGVMAVAVALVASHKHYSDLIMGVMAYQTPAS